MQELREGLWRWSAPHPDWKPESDWEQQVSCFAHASSDGVVLIDPLVEGGGDWGELDGLAEAAGSVAAVAVTVHWHERNAAEAARRYDAPLYAPALGERDSLKDALDIVQGERLPGGVEPVVLPEAEEALLFLSEARTLVAGDVLLAREGRLSLCPPSWLDREDDLEAVRQGARRALQLPFEAVAVAHGEPVLFEGREPLKDALR